MICEGSCDTEDWSNDAEKKNKGINYIFKTYSNSKLVLNRNFILNKCCLGEHQRLVYFQVPEMMAGFRSRNPYTSYH